MAQGGVLVRSLAEQVYRQLRSKIIQGVYPAKAKLVELDIAAETGTSQGTVREALQRLEREGLVERQAHRGTTVTEIALDEIYELFAVRCLIEGFAVKRAAQHMQTSDIERLESLVTKMQRAANEGDINLLVEHDMEFHRLICELSRSRILLNAWTPLYSQIQRFVVQTHPNYFRDLNNLADTHLPLLEPLRQRDGEQAARALQAHIMLIWTWIQGEAAEQQR